MSNNLPYTTTYNIEGLTNGNTTIVKLLTTYQKKNNRYSK